MSSNVTSARFSSLTSTAVTIPVRTPAMRTSEPLKMPNALSISIR